MASHQEKWIHIFRALVDERGPWSANPFPNSIKTHWKLDKTEDSWRRRIKLKRNYKFDERLCHPPVNKSSSETSHMASASHMGTGGSVPEQMKHFLLKGVRGILEEMSSEIGEDASDLTPETESILSDSSESQNSNHIKGSPDHLETVQDRNEIPSSSIEGETSEVCNT